MDIIVTVCVVEDGQVLLVQEAKAKAYGLWNLPSGHLELSEDIFDGAIREVMEETGYDVAITGLISIHNVIRAQNPMFRVNFIGKVKQNIGSYDTSEILQVKWIPLEELSKFSDNYRSYESFRDIITDLLSGTQYPITLIKNILC